MDQNIKELCPPALAAENNILLRFTIRMVK